MRLLKFDNMERRRETREKKENIKSKYAKIVNVI